MFTYDGTWSVSLVTALFTGIPISIVILIYAYLKIRPKFPARVNCWFCHERSDVPYDNRNCWDCPRCEQYNGFSADGGYNKVIPAQHDELLNHSVTVQSPISKKCSPVNSKSPFCRKCTINQDLKIQQLASFTPRDPIFFDEEIEEYRQHLERAYQLCESCELVVKHTLNRQKGWLLDQHRKQLLSLHSQSTPRVLTWWQRGLPVVWLQKTQMVSTTIVAVLLLSHCHEMFANSFSQFISPDIAYTLELIPNYEYVVASVVTCFLIVITGCSSIRRTVDIITGVLWFIMFCHNWVLLSPYFKNNISEMDLKLGHLVVIVLTVLVNVLAAVTSCNVLPAKKAVLKKFRNNENRLHRGRDITGHFNNPAVPIIGESDKPSLHSNSPLHNIPSFSPPSTLIDSDRYSPLQPTAFGVTSPTQESYSSPGDLEWSLQKLSLGPSNVRNRNCSPFKTKPYGTEPLNIFQSTFHKAANGEHHLPKNHAPLLKPPKLNIRRNVTQTSWVAGGYWRELGGTLSKAVQSGRNLFETSIQSPERFSPLSRTSSQSSGFHSHSSNSPASLPNSWNGSMCGGDVDRVSVHSESVLPTLSCRCGVNDHSVTRAVKPSFVGLQYYGGFPVCIPHICPMGVTSSPSGLFSPRNVPWMINQQCFAMPKQYLPGSCYFSPFPQTPGKQFPLSAPPIADAVSHSGSSLHSRGHRSVSKTVKNNYIWNVWEIMKQNVMLSVLCMGSVMVNVIGMVILMYKSQSLLQL